MTLVDLPLFGLFSPDGKSYVYPDPPFAANRILKRPVGGGAGTEVARVSGELFFGGAPAADGKLILSRGTALTDVVLISTTGGRRDLDR